MDKPSFFTCPARSDITLELASGFSQPLPEGLSVNTQKHGCVNITCVSVTSSTVSKKIKKPQGRYITIETPPLWNSLLDPQDEINAAADCIRHLLPSCTSVLVVGLGNSSITPDALGPAVIERIIATRHLGKELAAQLGLDSLRKTSAIAPGVMGQTGIETGEIIQALVNFIHPTAVIAVDALAAQEYSRLGRTIQIADNGISPGSGVQNSRKELSEKTLGVPVISIGVPTVIDGATLAASFHSENFDSHSSCAACAMVTPREIDRIIGHSAKFISLAINKALYPQLSLEEISFLCS